MHRPKDHLLVLTRHGQSEGNLRNVFTGWRDLPLTEQGREQAIAVGKHLRERGVALDAAFSSALGRARDSCAHTLREMGLAAIPVRRDSALNERDYGDLTGLDKNEARRRFGAEQVQTWRRSYAVAPPGGESLRDTVARVLPFYIREILPAVLRHRGVLVVAHGNSLRALILALEGLSPDEIARIELDTGETRFYLLNDCAEIRSHGVWH
ncbi:2,3-bisphosphoglycerate-dependent phosphoglycerate mutase [Bradyrhizobium tropiciagri]|uniref:2,3-bisphosphoglycerate-dependent phosphoglycerate mutase n=1 Tax=Bradyrhizobium tropiciagri TaxID=312253 RepID=UPI000ABC7826